MTLPVTTATHSGKTAPDRLREGEEMLRLKALGMQVSELCARFGVSRATLYRRLDDALKARVAVTVDGYREEQNRLLDLVMERWEQQLAGADAMIHEGTVKESMSLVERGMTKRGEALNSMLRVSERRAKLNGLDAPVKGELTLTVTSPIDAAVAALAAEVEQVAM